MPVDPITLAVVRGSLEQIADEMDLLLYRAAFSTIVSEGHDAANGFYDADSGETIVQGKFGLPVFVGVMSFAAKAVIEHLRARHEQPAPGDTFLFNDPVLSGTHLQDIKLVRPFFHGGELFCYLANTGHWTDVGGNVPGGYNARATEIFQEGVRFPPVRLYTAGRLNQDILDIVLANNRMPRIGYGDLSAQMNALDMGEKRLAVLLDKYGLGTVREVLRELNVRSEQMMRAHITAIPDGTYAFEDALDNDGIVDRPIRVALDLGVRGTEMTLDFSRSDPPCAGPFNMPLATSIASCYIAIKHLFTDVPVNAGCFRPIRFVIPERTFLNVRGDRPMAGYTEVTPCIIGVIWGALGRAIPEQANAAYFATVNPLNIAGLDDEGNYYVMFTYYGGGHGGSPESDGLNHGSNAISMATIAPVEVLEGNFPILYERWALRPDSAGPGHRRGGLGSVYAIKLLGREAKAFFMGDRGKVGPFGIHGGGRARGNEYVLTLGEREWRPPMGTKAVDVPMARGDVLELRTPGGGGYGDPFTREPERVALDVRRGYVTPEAARRDYGVAVREDFGVDGEETTRFRQEHRTGDGTADERR